MNKKLVLVIGKKGLKLKIAIVEKENEAEKELFSAVGMNSLELNSEIKRQSDRLNSLDIDHEEIDPQNGKRFSQTKMKIVACRKMDEKSYNSVRKTIKNTILQPALA